MIAFWTGQKQCTFITFVLIFIMKRVITILCCLFGLSASILSLAQLAPERLAWNNLGKEKWAKVETQVKKALRKDSLNIAARYVYSWYLFTPASPSYNIDSAFYHVNKTIRQFRISTSKERDRWLRFPVDSALLTKLRHYIDSAAFERAKEKNTEEAYQFFVNQFIGAVQIPAAIELQHEVAFVDALKINNYLAFRSFLDRYPHSSRAEEAQKRYDKLLFETKTKDKKLASYQHFLQDHPKTPYRKEAERQIFELLTASGESDSFEIFIKNNSNNHLVPRARDFLFHIYKERDADLFHLLNDSLRTVLDLNSSTWLPVWKSGSYSFIDVAGNEYLPSIGHRVEATVLCKGFAEDIFLVDNNLFARNGKLLKEGVVDYRDLGYGIVLAQLAKETAVIHKSGVELFRPDGEPKLIGHHFVLFKNGNHSSLFTLTGRKLLTDSWEAVHSIGDAVAFQTKEGWRLATNASIGNSANGEPVVYTAVFNEIKSMTDNYIWVRSGTQHGLLTNSLKQALPLREQKIADEYGIITVTRKSGSHTFSNDILSMAYDKLSIHSQWTIGKLIHEFILMSRSTSFQPIINEFDSLYVLATIAIGIRNDSTFAFIGNSSLSFSGNPTIEALSSADSTYICIHEFDRKTVVSRSGDKLFSITCDKLEYAGAGFFVAAKKEKKFILGLDGKLVTTTDFDALGNASQQYISILFKKKFGLINRILKKEIKPFYERNITPYTPSILVAYKDNAYGFIDWDNRPLSRFEFEEIRYWNDSVALVKHNFSWRLYSLDEKNFKPGKISEYSLFKKNEAETIAVFKQGNYFGVMSSKKGVLLESTFTDIINLGTNDTPLYFTEKYIEEAAIYIVIYYDQYGKQVRRQVFEEDEYKKIKCAE